VVAINISTQPFQAAFDGFKLITGNGVDREVTFKDFILTR
jgi:hypothetical protein